MLTNQFIVLLFNDDLAIIASTEETPSTPPEVSGGLDVDIIHGPELLFSVGNLLVGRVDRMANVILYRGNDNLITVLSLRRNSTGVTLSSATVTMTLKTEAGANVTGAVDLPITYVVKSRGKYQGIIPSTVSLTAGAKYTIVVTATTTEGTVGVANIPAQAQDRIN